MMPPRTIRDPRPTDTAAEFIEARARRGRRARTYEQAPPPELIELRRNAVDLALVRIRNAAR
jgi:hypothetical protein